MGIPNPRPSKATVAVGSSSITIYAKLNELAPFLGVITADERPTVVISNQSVKSHSRRRYPGGPTKQVPGHARRRVVEQARPDQTLPGYNAWLERKVGAATLVEQFTFVGDFQDLKDYVKGVAVIPCVLRSPWGVAFDIVSAP